MVVTPVKLLAGFALFQCLHWFKPSEPYLVEYASVHYGVPFSIMLSTVFPTSTYGLFGATIVMAAIFLLIGYRGALVACALTGVATVCVALWGSSLAMLVLSSILYSMLPPALYGVAASLNSASMLLGSIGSALVGFAIAIAHPGQQSVVATFYVSLASSVASAAVLGAMLAAGWLPARVDKALQVAHTVPQPAVAPLLPRTSAGEGPSTLSIQQQQPGVSSSNSNGGGSSSSMASLWAITKETLGRRDAVLWLLASIAMRGPHTLVITNWTELSSAVDSHPAAQAYNGLIIGVAYGIAAAAVTLPAALRSAERRMGHCLPAVLGCACIGCLLLLSHVATLLQLSIVLCVYHPCAETLLAIASARIARALPLARGDAGFENQFVLAMAGKFFGAITLQLVMQLIINRIFHASTRQVFTWYAAAMAITLLPAAAAIICCRRQQGRT